MNVTIDTKAGTITITCALQDLRPSSTGKSMLLVSETEKGAAQFQGKPVHVTVNAYQPIGGAS